MSLLLISVAYHLKLPSGLIQALHTLCGTVYISAQKMYWALFIWLSMTNQTIRVIDRKDGTGSNGARTKQPQPHLSNFLKILLFLVVSLAFSR